MPDQPDITSRRGPPRVMFLTIGRAPREDMVPEIAALVDLPLEVHQLGILDDLSRRSIEELTAAEDEPALVTHLTRNIRVRLSRRGVAARLNAILAGFRPSEYDLVVILATGFTNEITARGPVLNAQRAVDSALMSLLPSGQSVGIIHPLVSQSYGSFTAFPAFTTFHFSAGEGDRDALLRALYELGEVDLVLLSSVSYGEEDYRTLARVTQKPVLLSRRILAGAIRLVLLSDRAGGRATISTQARMQLACLTPRQSEILKLVCDGRSSKEIATALSISPKTVEVHRANIMSKMGVRSTGALISMVLGRSPDGVLPRF